MKTYWVLYMMLINSADENKQPTIVERQAVFPTHELCKDAETEAEWQNGIDSRNDPRGKVSAWGSMTRHEWDCKPWPFVERGPSMRLIEPEQREEKL